MRTKRAIPVLYLMAAILMAPFAGMVFAEPRDTDSHCSCTQSCADEASAHHAGGDDDKACGGESCSAACGGCVMNLAGALLSVARASSTAHESMLSAPPTRRLSGLTPAAQYKPPRHSV